jgi:hypothetical protein
MRYYGIIFVVWRCGVSSSRVREKGENFKGRRCRGADFTLHKHTQTCLGIFFRKTIKVCNAEKYRGCKNFLLRNISVLRGGKLRNENIFTCTWEGKNVFRIVLSFIIEPFFLLFLSLSPTYVVFVALSTLFNDCDDDDDIVVEGMAWQHG